MIEDIIEREVNNNEEYVKLEEKINEMTTFLNNLQYEQVDVHLKDIRLERFANVAQVITILCLFSSITNILPYIVVFLAQRKAKNITKENKEFYQKEIADICSEIENYCDDLLDLYYKICDDVEVMLTPLKEEIMYYLRNRNYSQIINDYLKYEDALPLIENEIYNNLLSLLIGYGRNGISFESLSNEEKQFIDLLNYNAENLNRNIKYKNKETLGQKIKKMDECEKTRK